MKLNQDSAAGDRRVNLKIRPMQIDDLAGVFHLGENLSKAAEVPNLYRTWDEFEVVELFNSDADFCLVAEVDERLVGFALGNTITNTHSAWKYGHLIWLGVAPSFQRLGVAERRFDRFRDIMVKDGVRMLSVDTEAENLSALHFFRKLGFGSPQQHIYLTMNLAPRQYASRRSTSRPRAKGCTPPPPISPRTPSSPCCNCCCGYRDIWTRRDRTWSTTFGTSTAPGPDFRSPTDARSGSTSTCPPPSPSVEITSELEELVSAEARNSDPSEAVLNIVIIDAGYELPAKGAVMDAFRRTYAARSLPWEPGMFRSHSAANRLWAVGVRPVLLGPGKLERAHAPDESVSFRQACLAAQIYLDTILALISRTL